MTQQIVKYNELKLRPEEGRLRSEVGDLFELKESLKKNGQIHDLLVDENWFVRIGTRRYLAMEGIIKNVKVEYRAGLSDDEWLILEAEENLIRKDFNVVEEAIALTKAKEAYERLHPETIQGAKGLEIMNESPKPQIADLVKKSKLEIKPVELEIPKEEIMPLPEAFTVHMAKKKNVSRDTVERKVKLGEAILAGKIDEETVEKIKKKEISQHKAMKKLKEKEDKRLGEILKKKQEEDKKRVKKMEHTIFPGPVRDETSYKADQYRKIRMCEECTHAQVKFCIECKKGLIVCTRSSNIVFKDLNSRACENFKKP